MDDAVRESEKGVLIDLTVSPNAKKTEIVGYNKWRKSIEVKVSSPPRGGKANAELIRFLKNVFGRNVKIVKGQTSTQKTILIEGISRDDVIKILRNISKQGR